MTTRRKRHSITPMTYRMPPDIADEIDDLVDQGIYVSRPAAMSALLRFALDHRKFDLMAALREILSTEEGIALVRQAARRKPRKKE